jgi:Spy/CpxP family protein refolding chaperone
MRRISQIVFSTAIVVAVAFQSPSVVGQEEAQPDVEVGEAVTEMTVMAVDDGGGAPAVFFSSGDGEMSAPLIPGIAGGSFSMPAPDPWNMIGNPSVQMDLDLVDEQKDQIKSLKQEMSEEMRGLMGQLQGGQINPEVIGRLKSAQSDYKEKMMELLLPNQKDRLKQIALQMHMKNAGTTTAITNNAVAEMLNLSPEQTEKLKKKSEELKEKLAVEIEKLKAKMKDELLAELTPEQREKLKELKGDKYQPQKTDWSNRIKQLRNRARPEKH